VAGCGSSMIRLRWLRHGAVGRGADALEGFHVGSKMLLEDHQRTERDLATGMASLAGRPPWQLAVSPRKHDRRGHRERRCGARAQGRRPQCTPGSGPEEAVAHRASNQLTYPASMQLER